MNQIILNIKTVSCMNQNKFLDFVLELRCFKQPFVLKHLNSTWIHNILALLMHFILYIPNCSIGIEGTVTTFVFLQLSSRGLCVSAWCLIPILTCSQQIWNLMHAHLAQAAARGGPIYCFKFYDGFLNSRVWSTKISLSIFTSCTHTHTHKWRVSFQPLSPSLNG